MPTIYIENKPYEVKDGQNLLRACLSLGFNLPYFCWHPAMHSVGACRQCAVKEFKDEHDTKGRLIMACMTPVKEGARISIDDPEAKSFRAGVIEWLMTNHPHDCPVCDEGSECHLQDMTVMTGHAYRRYRFKKRTYRNQYLGPFLTHEMNRCIACYRCVRFYRDYAGGRDLDVFAWHNHVYFGRHRDGVLENEFSGNLAEVCPTGVFTDKTLARHYTRKWDLQTAPSVCVHCCLGCNTIPGERYGELRRIRNRYNGRVNRYFLCDRGRYGYEFVNSALRIRRPLLLDEAPRSGDGCGKGTEVTKEDAVGRTAGILSSGAKAIGIGSPRASLEANFALRTLVGAENFYHGMSTEDSGLVSLIIDILRNGPARTPSLSEAEAADAVFVLGEDVTNTAPVLALALRQSVYQKPLELVKQLHIPEWDDAAVREAVQNNWGPLFLATPYRTKLEDRATHSHRASPGDIARLGFAVAHELHAGSPQAPGMPEEELALARSVAQALRDARRPLIVSGTGCGSEAVVQAAADIAWALCAEGKNALLSYAVPECNSIGLGLMGGGSLADAFKAVRDGAADTAVILENDLYRHADAGAVDDFLGRTRHLIVLDHLENRTSRKAEVAFPAAAFAEAGGTLVNNEGRAQRFYRVFVSEGTIQESWRWLRDIMAARRGGQSPEWKNLDAVMSALAGALPVFREIVDIAPPAGFRIRGMRIPRQPHRYSGRTAMYANLTVFEPAPPRDPDSPLAFSMEGYPGEPPSPLIPRFWAPGWNSPQAVNKFQSEVGGPLHGGDPGRRLIEPQSGKEPAFFGDVPEAFVRRSDAWLFVPVRHIFGSDELSLLSPGIAELSPKPYIGLDLKERNVLQAAEGERLIVHINGAAYRLPARHMAGLPAGVAALPAGLPGVPWIALPAWGAVSKAGAA